MRWPDREEWTRSAHPAAAEPAILLDHMASSSPRTAVHLALLALLAVLAGCASGPVSPAAGPVPPATVIDWAAGPEHLGGGVPDDADTYLMVVPTETSAAGDLESDARASSTPVTKCLHASSFLPAPAGDPRIFFLVKGDVYVLQSAGQQPEPLRGNPLAIGVTRLLALEIGVSPSRLLVAAKPAGAPKEQLWILTVKDQAIVQVTPATEGRGLTGREAFFAAYRVPRCLDKDQRCLTTTSVQQSTYVDVERVRGRDPKTLLKLGQIDAIDAAWASADGTSAYLLAVCR